MTKPLSTLTSEVEQMSKEILEVNQLSVNYGAIKAVRDVSFDIKEGEIVT